MKKYQKLLLCGVVLLIIIFILSFAGRVTTRAVYLWDAKETKQLAEVDRNSLVLQINEGNNLSYVFYFRGCKFGYIKKEYLTDIFHRVAKQNIEID